MNNKKIEEYNLKRKQELIQRARSGNILAFTKYTMPDYQISWHHSVMGQKLNDFIKRKIKRLMIFAPPRHGKSELTSRRLPALIHGLYPNDEILAASYNAELASDMTIDCQRIMDKPEYHEIFPNSVITPEGTKSPYARNSSEHELMPYEFEGKKIYPQGSYRSAGVGGSFTGRGGNWVLLDDLVKNRQDADSKNFRDTMESFYTSTIRTRLEGDASILLTLTRWHDDDLAGRLLRLSKANPIADQWNVLVLPAIRDNLDNPLDHRLIGEPLWESKFNLKWMESTRESIGTRDWEALYMQRPTTDGGNIVKADWIKYYKSVPPKFDEMIQSWDFATKDKNGSDYTVGSVYGRVGPNKYLLYQVRGRFSFPIAVQKVIDLTRAFPQAHKKYVEAKANGPAIVQTLRDRIGGFIEVEPRGDKVSRLNAVAPEYEGGNVWYPDPSIAPWIKEHVSEICNFPSDAHDDRVDAETQALDKLRKTGPVYAPISGHGSGVIF
jgi:predicted phage terminase large subunit-like protein